MAQFYFRLNKGKKITNENKPQPIYFRYREGAKVDYNASLKVKVLPSTWDDNKQRIKNRSNIKDRQSINSLLARVENHFQDLINQNKSNGVTPSYTEVKNHFLKLFQDNAKEEQGQKAFMDYYESFIERAAIDIVPSTGKPLTNGTIKTYKTTYQLLKAFEAEVYNLSFEKLNYDFHLDFITFCEKRQLSPNYIGKNVKNIKTLVRSAIDRNVIKDSAYLSNKIKVFTEKVDNIYLTLEELERISRLELQSEKHTFAKDLFLIGAFTGLRVSDFNNLNERNIIVHNQKEFLRVEQRKTSKEVYIPIHPKVKTILEKYDYTIPYLPEQTINKCLKDLGEWAGIDESITITRTTGGKKRELTIPKFTLIKTHTARRSFCTNTYLEGMPVLDIMAISGHTSEKTFLNYIKVTPKERASNMANHPFFT